MQPWYLFRTFLTETFCMQPESKDEDTKSVTCCITHLVCPKFSSVSVERTVVVGLSKQGLDGEKDGADLRKIMLLLLMLYLRYLARKSSFRGIFLSLCESRKRLEQSDLLLNTS